MLATTLCTDLLPARTANCRGAGFTWCRCTRTLAVTTSRGKPARSYLVAELPAAAEFGGRAFQLAKMDAGSDSEATGYACLVADAGPGWDSCECKGFLRWSHCSHLDSLRGILANGWADAAPEVPDPTDEDLDRMAADFEAQRSGSWFDADEVPAAERPAGCWADRDADLPDCFKGIGASGRMMAGVPF